MSKAFLQIVQVASPIRRHRRQRQTLVGLGLNRVGRVRVLEDTSAVRGMLGKVAHMVRVLPVKPNDEER